jgi:hypothetical protein
MLEREEYVEQAYFFRVLRERIPQNLPMQECLRQVKDELLASSKLPMAIDFLRTELEHAGILGDAMARLSHYFSPFQTYVIQEAENERGRFDMLAALAILQAEAEYRGRGATPQGLFIFQFEVLCRNRLRYDKCLTAIASDPWYDANWREWIVIVRRQIGLIEFADLVYIRSEYFQKRRLAQLDDGQPPDKPVLFGEKEGKIAWANRRKDPLFLFAAMQRHLGYPAVPRPIAPDESPQLLPQMMRRMERLENRLKLLEEEQIQGAIDITKLYSDRKE